MVMESGRKLERWPARGFAPRPLSEIARAHAPDAGSDGGGGAEPEPGASSAAPASFDELRPSESDVVGRKLQMRRVALGLRVESAAQAVALSPESYALQLEHNDRELFASFGLAELKRVCTALDLGFFDLFDMGCDFCGHQREYLAEFRLPRHELVRRRRLAHGWSCEALGDRIGLYEDAIRELESFPEEIESWPLELIEPLAYELHLPAQVILKAPCPRCAR
jgi:hypothetical protein